MESGAEAKILQLLDVISVEVTANRNQTTRLGEEMTQLAEEMRSEFTSVRREMRTGFDRVERRLGNLENRVENVETELRDFRGEFERRISPLEH